MPYIEIIRLVITLLPLLIELIKTIDAAMPDKGQGPAKLEMAKGILEGAHAASNNPPTNFDTLWPVLNKAISGIVAALNATGQLGQKS